MRELRSGSRGVLRQLLLRNLNGRRPDGSETLHASSGPVGGCFFGEPSFATYALAHKRNTVKVRKDAPLEMLGPLGCGIQTGAGAVLNVLKPERGSSFALFGCGGVGLAALMGARIAGCDPIVAVDKVPSRLELAKRLGATLVIDASKEDPVKRLTGMGGMSYVIEAAGIASVIAQAMQVVRSHGICGILGVVKPDATLTVNILQAFSGRTVMGIIEGDADPHVFIPYLVDKFMAGEPPLDLLVRFYPFEEINKAVADSNPDHRETDNPNGLRREYEQAGGKAGSWRARPRASDAPLRNCSPRRSSCAVAGRRIVEGEEVVDGIRTLGGRRYSSRPM